MNAFDVSVAVFVRGLTNLKAMLVKAEAHASATGADPGALLKAKLAEDMYDVAVQTHWAGEGAKLAVARLLGAAPAPPRPAAEAKTFQELYDRIDATLADLVAVDRAALDAGLDRTIEIPHRGATMTYRGDRFLTEFAVPGFYFHLVTAYGILRHEGIPLQKGDFLGG